jgi:hypothetical protein
VMTGHSQVHPNLTTVFSGILSGIPVCQFSPRETCYFLISSVEAYDLNRERNLKLLPI